MVWGAWQGTRIRLQPAQQHQLARPAQAAAGLRQAAGCAPSWLGLAAPLAAKPSAAYPPGLVAPRAYFSCSVTHWVWPCSQRASVAAAHKAAAATGTPAAWHQQQAGQPAPTCTLRRSKLAEQSMQVKPLALHWLQCCAILGCSAGRQRGDTCWALGATNRSSCLCCTAHRASLPSPCRAKQAAAHLLDGVPAVIAVEPRLQSQRRKIWSGRRRPPWFWRQRHALHAGAPRAGRGGRASQHARTRVAYHRALSGTLSAAPRCTEVMAAERVR